MVQNAKTTFWEEIRRLNVPIVALDRALKCVENSCQNVLVPVLLCRERSPMAGDGFLQLLWV